MIKKSIAYVTIASMALGGCVTTREDRIGVDDGKDACYQQRVLLDSTGDYFAESMIAGAAIGAITGAAAGLIIQGNARGALIGAVSGAALGAAGGYWQAKMQQGREQAVLSVISDAQKESETLSKTQLALDQLLKCRRGEISKVKADLKAKRISREEAEQRMAAIRNQLNKDYEIATKISADATKRRDEFVKAANEIQPGAADKIAKAANKKPSKINSNAKPDAQAVGHVTSAYQTCERINKAPAQFQSAMLEADVK